MWKFYIPRSDQDQLWVAEYLHLYKRRLNVQKFVLLTWQFDILRSDQDPEKVWIRQDPENNVDPTGSRFTSLRIRYRTVPTVCIA